MNIPKHIVGVWYFNYSASSLSCLLLCRRVSPEAYRSQLIYSLSAQATPLPAFDASDNERGGADCRQRTTAHATNWFLHLCIYRDEE